MEATVSNSELKTQNSDLAVSFGAVQIAEQVAHHGRDIAHRRDRARVGHPRGPYHAKHADNLAGDAVARQHHAVLTHLITTVLTANHNLHAVTRQRPRYQWPEALAALDHLQHLPHPAHLAELGLVQHLDQPVAVDFAVELLFELAHGLGDQLQHLALHLVE